MKLIVFFHLPVHDIDHALGVGVTVVGVVGRTLVDHGLVNGVGGLVGENASGQAGDDLLDLQFTRFFLFFFTQTQMH